MSRSIRSLATGMALACLLSGAYAAPDKPEASPHATAAARPWPQGPQRVPHAVTMAGLVSLILVGQVLLRRR